ncbi:MAG: hypothetical protein PVF45_11065, partial [Anaerolineae bacterium]
PVLSFLIVNHVLFFVPATVQFTAAHLANLSIPGKARATIGATPPGFLHPQPLINPLLLYEIQILQHDGVVWMLVIFKIHQARTRIFVTFKAVLNLLVLRAPLYVTVHTIHRVDPALTAVAAQLLRRHIPRLSDGLDGNLLVSHEDITSATV